MLQGLLIMSAEVEAAFQSISLNQIPAMWAKASYPSLKPMGAYLEDLYKRLKMLQVSICRWRDLFCAALPNAFCHPNPTGPQRMS